MTVIEYYPNRGSNISEYLLNLVETTDLKINASEWLHGSTSRRQKVGNITPQGCEIRLGFKDIEPLLRDDQQCLKDWFSSFVQRRRLGILR